MCSECDVSFFLITLIRLHKIVRGNDFKTSVLRYCRAWARTMARNSILGNVSPHDSFYSRCFSCKVSVLAASLVSYVDLPWLLLSDWRSYPRRHNEAASRTS